MNVIPWFWTMCTPFAADVRGSSIHGNTIISKEKTMKKFVLLMALCVVLFGAVTTVTGCGTKPRNADLLKVNSTVWKETLSPGEAPIKQKYLCFHSNGHLYLAEEQTIGKKDFKKTDTGTYSIDSEKVTINNASSGSSTSLSYTLKGVKLNIKDNPGFPNDFIKVDLPTEAQIKAYADQP